MPHPADVTRRCVERYEEIGLPPVCLHDLRHGAATLVHTAGAGARPLLDHDRGRQAHEPVAMAEYRSLAALPLTQTAPDEESEAEWNPPWGRNPRSER